MQSWASSEGQFSAAEWTRHLKDAGTPELSIQTSPRSLTDVVGTRHLVVEAWRTSTLIVAGHGNVDFK